MKKMVTFTVCQRPGYFVDVLDSWSAVRGIGDWIFNFRVEPTAELAAQLALIERFTTGTGLTTAVTVNPHRFGVLINPWYALSDAFDYGAGFCVLAEEDLLVSDDVLEMFGFAAANFEDDARIAAVCASSLEQIPPTAAGGELLVVADDFSPHIWGTWCDRWYGVLRDSWDTDYSTGNPDGSQAGWDWNIDKRILPREGLRTLRPVHSRSCNIGKLGGVHQIPSQFAATVAPSFTLHRPPVSYRVPEVAGV